MDTELGVDVINLLVTVVVVLILLALMIYVIDKEWILSFIDNLKTNNEEEIDEEGREDGELEGEIDGDTGSKLERESDEVVNNEVSEKDSGTNNVIGEKENVAVNEETGDTTNNGTGDPELDEAIKTAGFCYEPDQDIFYSDMNPWQRNEGYCSMYDDASAALGMIVDAEPIYFNYDGRRWLIEFWKGQYDLSAGCEIGVYVAEGDNLNKNYKEILYSSAGDKDLLDMSFELLKGKEVIMARKGKHWWLTGFKVGEYVEPSELTMKLSITLKDVIMRNSFIKGLRRAGYSTREIGINGDTISLEFVEPHSKQPFTRTKNSDTIIQVKNLLLCYGYQIITSPYDNFPDKMKALKERAPMIYDSLITMFAGDKKFTKYKEIQKMYY